MPILQPQFFMFQPKFPMLQSKFSPFSLAEADCILGLTMKGLFQKFNTNDNGKSKGVIDSTEEKDACSSAFFVEKGMNFSTFKTKNETIFEALCQTALEIVNANYGYINNPLTPSCMMAVQSMRNASKSSGVEKIKFNIGTEINKVVNDIIKNGQFAEKKDVILGKMSYLTKETRELVMSYLSEEEKAELQNK